MSEDRIDELTAFEVSMAEKAARLSFSVLADETAPKLDLLGALAWVHRKREEPTLTFEDYMKSVTATEITGYLFPDDDEDEAGESVAGFPEPVGSGVGEAGPASGPGPGEGGVLSGDRGSTE